jgi:hypothetical protein
MAQQAISQRRVGGAIRLSLRHAFLYGLLSLLVVHIGYSGAYYAWNWDFGGGTEFADDFAAGNLEGWRRHGDVQLCCAHSAVFVNSERKPGSLALQFSLHGDDPDVKGSKRAELRLKAVPFGQDRWYLASLRVRTDWEEASEPATVLQWHAVDDKILGEVSRSPPLRLLIQDHEWVIVSRWDSRPLTGVPIPRGALVGEQVLWRGALDVGVSIDWLFRVRWSYGSDGIVVAWRNGIRIACYEGPNAYNDLMGPYLKVGIYVPSWKIQTNRDVTHRDVIVERVRQSANQVVAWDRLDAMAVNSPVNAHSKTDHSNCDWPGYSAPTPEQARSRAQQPR